MIDIWDIILIHDRSYKDLSGANKNVCTFKNNTLKIFERVSIYRIVRSGTDIDRLYINSRSIAPGRSKKLRPHKEEH